MFLAAGALVANVSQSTKKAADSLAMGQALA
jgi:hypothetical protein